MNELKQNLRTVRREHPVFFWGAFAVIVLLVSGATVLGTRAFLYHQEATSLTERLTEAEKATRDRLLDSRARRSELALALLQRELRLKSLEEDEVHLALSIDDSTLALRHGAATLREVPVQVGPDSVVAAPDGRTWRFVRALGERHLAEMRQGAEYVVPEWVYVARGEAVPDEAERRVAQGLGRYVLVLDDGTEIYSTPESGPFAESVKPASFEVAEADLQAIFEALKRDTPVYIY